MIPATVVIPARDSAATIRRAVRSACAQDVCGVILVDDWSSDGTAEAARTEFPGLEVIRPVEHRTLGFTRQTALDTVATDYLIWLDADDELLPGRAARLVGALADTGADYASDAVELVDGRSGAGRGTLHVPAFLRADLTLSRLFERNYLPAPGAVAARTATARRVGYDAAFHGVEDVDHLLRAIAVGARWCLLDEPGYRQYAYPASLSRNLANQRRMWAAALRKHAYCDVERYLERGGWAPRVRQWALVSIAIVHGDWNEALDRLEALAASCPEAGVVLEANGPCPLPETWRVAFHMGTVRALAGEPASATLYLRTALEIRDTPDARNNLGVVLRMQGDAAEAQRCFEQAAQGFPGYGDALANLAGASACRLTSHPLRRDRWRDDYQPQDVATS